MDIRRLELFNVALVTSHIWSILTLKESLWVKWIHTHKLRGRNFWDIPFRGNMSWGGGNYFKSDLWCINLFGLELVMVPLLRFGLITGAHIAL